MKQLQTQETIKVLFILILFLFTIVIFIKLLISLLDAPDNPFPVSVIEPSSNQSSDPTPPETEGEALKRYVATTREVTEGISGQHTATIGPIIIQYWVVDHQQQDNITSLYTFAGRILNSDTSELRPSTFLVSSNVLSTTIVDGQFQVGSLPASNATFAIDTISLLHDHTTLFDPSNLHWTREPWVTVHDKTVQISLKAPASTRLGTGSPSDILPDTSVFSILEDVSDEFGSVYFTRHSNEQNLSLTEFARALYPEPYADETLTTTEVAGRPALQLDSMTEFRIVTFVELDADVMEVVWPSFYGRTHPTFQYYASILESLRF